jgi:hypothetical protein
MVMMRMGEAKELKLGYVALSKKLKRGVLIQVVG